MTNDTVKFHAVWEFLVKFDLHVDSMMFNTQNEE